MGWRPCILLFLFVVIVIGWHNNDWDHRLWKKPESNATVSLVEKYSSEGQEALKERIILSQEQRIHKLNKLVTTLHEQLLECMKHTNTVNVSEFSLTEHLSKLAQQSVLED